MRLTPSIVELPLPRETRNTIDPFCEDCAKAVACPGPELPLAELLSIGFGAESELADGHVEVLRLLDELQPQLFDDPL